MKQRFLVTLLLHLVGIILLLLPNQYQGSVVASFSSISLRVVDAVGIIFVLAGTVYMFTSLLLQLKEQMTQSAERPVNQRLKEPE